MLVFNVGDLKIGVQFAHRQFDEPSEMTIEKDGRKSRLPIRGTTTCTVFELPDGDPKNATEVAKGTAYCSAKDAFNKEKGRRISLRESLVVADYGYTTRSGIWNSYFDSRPSKDPR